MKKQYLFKMVLSVLVLLCVVTLQVSIAETFDYPGIYSGTLSGDDNGEWLAIVEANGDVNGLVWSETGSFMDLINEWTINSEGHIAGETLLIGSEITLDIHASGNVSGTWLTEVGSESISGTISGAIQTETSQYAGTYSGTYSGDASGSWEFTAEPSGIIDGRLTSPDGTYPIDGVVNSDGTIFALASDDDGTVGLGMYGRISGADVDGDWSDSLSEAFYGTFTGGPGRPKGTGSSSGGGGCFIQSLF